MLLVQLKQMKLISAWVLFESTEVDDAPDPQSVLNVYMWFNSLHTLWKDIAILCSIYTYMCPFLDIASIYRLTSYSLMCFCSIV